LPIVAFDDRSVNVPVSQCEQLARDVMPFALRGQPAAIVTDAVLAPLEAAGDERNPHR
jgi:hypothetical protein